MPTSPSRSARSAPRASLPRPRQTVAPASGSASPPHPATPSQSKLPAKFKVHDAERAQKKFKGLIYGDYGAGKTQLGGTAQLVPEMSPMLVIDAEAGELTLVEGTKVVTVTTYSEFARVFDFLKAHCRERDAVRKGVEGAKERLATLNEGAGFPPDIMFETVMIDSLSEVQQYLLYQITGTVIGRDKLDEPPDLPERGEYNESYQMTQLAARSFRDLPMHVIIICSVEEVRLGEGSDQKGNAKQRVVKRILMSGKLSTRIQGFWDLVGFLEVQVDQQGEHRRLWLQAGHERFHAKNRLTNLAYVDEPTMQKLFTLLKESRDAHPAPENRPAQRPSPPRQLGSARREGGGTVRTIGGGGRRVAGGRVG